MLQLSGIAKSYGPVPVLSDVSLQVEDGKTLVLLGPSGCGKTTLLRVIAGLTPPDAGAVHLDGVPLADIPVHQRGIGMVFQEYALFPHLDVGRNVGFGLRMLGWPVERINVRVGEALAWVGLEGFASRPVHALSGGERQRVALARSLAPAPRLLLLDEPLGSLDRALRDRLVEELRPILTQAGQAVGFANGITAVYVTHDQEEAFALGDRIAVMRRGGMEQVDSAQALYAAPATPFVARFLGMDNLLPATLVGGAPPRVSCALGTLRVSPSARRQLPDDTEVILLIRPDAATIEQMDDGRVDGHVIDVSFRGRYQVIQLVAASGPRLRLEFEGDIHLEAGDRISLWLRPDRLQVLPLAPAE